MRTVRVCGHTFIADWLSKDSIVVDLGMNRGEFSGIIAERLGCRIWGAEPDPRLFREVPAIPLLTKVAAAIGGRDGHQVFHLNTNVCSSLLFSEGGRQAETEAVRVPVLSLNSFLSEHGIERIDLLKIDIEGAEIDMFDHAPDDLLQKIEQITVEFHQFMDARFIPDVKRITERLQRLGFYGIDFSRDRYDVLFINIRRRPVGILSRIGFHVVKYWRGISRLLRGWTGRGEPPSWTVARDL